MDLTGSSQDYLSNYPQDLIPFRFLATNFISGPTAKGVCLLQVSIYRLKNMFSRLHSLTRSSSTEKSNNSSNNNNDDNNKTAQNSITCVYLANISELCRKVTATWTKSLVNYSLSINVENPIDDQNPYTTKIDLKSWQFWGKKGMKSFDIENGRVDVFWDFRQAKFSNHPEPCSDYYIALVSHEEVVLLLGDLKNDALKRTRKRPSLIEATLLCKKEHAFGKRLFVTKAILDDDGKKEHDIVIETSLCGPSDPEMWISIDGIVAIRIMNLNWRFRGNETVTVDDSPVQIFWDVHDWLYGDGTPSSSHGLFIFKPGELTYDQGFSNSTDSTEGNLSCSGFCHILYGWRTE
ncbi:hypothetical protein ACFE04_004863 [Oxalis oulophora]